MDQGRGMLSERVREGVGGDKGRAGMPGGEETVGFMTQGLALGAVSPVIHTG